MEKNLENILQEVKDNTDCAEQLIIIVELLDDSASFSDISRGEKLILEEARKLVADALKLHYTNED